MKGKLLLFILGKNTQMKYTNEPNIFNKRAIYLIVIFMCFSFCLPVFSQNDLRLTPGWLYNNDPTIHVINNEFWIFHAVDEFSEKFKAARELAWAQGQVCGWELKAVFSAPYS